jgi:hypothetical protein
MPLHSYRCVNGHETERLYLSISTEPEHYTPCDVCQLTAEHVEFPRIAPPNLPDGGSGGFYRPSVGGPIHNKPDSSKGWSELKQRGLVENN